MENEYLMSTAQTIKNQLMLSLKGDYNVYYSWGVMKRVIKVYNDMPCFALRVSGALHKGWVNICYNNGSDLYDIYFTSVRGTIKRVEYGVYCDQLGGVIDGVVECDPEWTIDEYKKAIIKDSKKKNII